MLQSLEEGWVVERFVSCTNRGMFCVWVTGDTVEKEAVSGVAGVICEGHSCCKRKKP